MATEAQNILEELRTIKEELIQIKEQMPNKDMFLTAEEKQLLEESFVNERERKTISGAALKKKLGL